MNSEQRVPAPSLTATGPLGQRGTILVVDDDRALRLVARKALESEGFAVSEAASGDAALQRLDREAVQAVLLDACMPGLSGFDTCARIRGIRGCESLPVIMATGLDDESSVERAFSVGASDYITKPINWPVLKRRMRTVVERQASEVAARLVQEDAAPLASDPSFSLDSEGVIRGVQHGQQLPARLAERLRIGACLFDGLPEHTRVGALDAWRDHQQARAQASFVIAEHGEQGAFVAEAHLIWSAGKSFCLIKDFTESYLAEQRLFKLANHDHVTGLANGRLFNKRVAQALERDRTQGQQTALCRFVLDNFRALHNQFDLHGIDTIARELSARLQAVFSSAEESAAGYQEVLVGRLSDQEFAVLLCGVGEPGFLEGTARLAVRRLAEPVEVDGYRVGVRASVGLACTPDAGRDAEGLMDSARFACAEGEFSAKGGVAVFSSELRDRVAHRNRIEQLLRRDLERGVLHMNYQPKFAVRDLSLVGIEALIRWNNDEFGMISPGEFIPLAERTGLMVPLSEFVIDSVLDQSAAWLAQGAVNVPIAINLPGSLLTRKGVVELLQKAVRQRGLTPQRLEIEVTEDVMIDRSSRVVEHLHQLQEMGVRIAIDDFGTGYSSLSYLRDLPVDILKIDMSFVRRIHEDPTALAIARAIVSVGHDLGLQVVAEGVETEPQFAKLREIGCDVIQGYYTGRPVAADSFCQSLDQVEKLCALG